jgi:hypothetical protein
MNIIKQIFKNFNKKTNRIIWSRKEGNFITYKRKNILSKKRVSLCFHNRTLNILTELIEDDITNKITYSLKKKKGYKKAVRINQSEQSALYRLHNKKEISLCFDKLNDVLGEIPVEIYYKIEFGKDEHK